MFEVAAGRKDDEERLRRKNFLEMMAIRSGAYRKTIFLNGGSQTRQETRDDYRAMFAGSNAVVVESNAYSITIRSSLAKS